MSHRFKTLRKTGLACYVQQILVSRTLHPLLRRTSHRNHPTHHGPIQLQSFSSRAEEENRSGPDLTTQASTTRHKVPVQTMKPSRCTTTTSPRSPCQTPPTTSPQAMPPPSKTLMSEQIRRIHLHTLAPSGLASTGGKFHHRPHRADRFQRRRERVLDDEREQEQREREMDALSAMSGAVAIR